MDRTVYRRPPKWWAPKLSSRWVRVWQPLRRIIQYKLMNLPDVTYSGLHHVTGAISRNEEVLDYAQSFQPYRRDCDVPCGRIDRDAVLFYVGLAGAGNRHLAAKQDPATAWLFQRRQGGNGHAGFSPGGGNPEGENQSPSHLPRGRGLSHQ